MSVARKAIVSPNAARPVAPYSQAVLAGDTLYISGCLGIEKDTNQLVQGGIRAETEQTLSNIGHILQAASSCFGNVVKTTVYLADINDFATVNEVYKQYFKDPYPARAACQVALLPMNARVEIDAIAIAGKAVCDM